MSGLRNNCVFIQLVNEFASRSKSIEDEKTPSFYYTMQKNTYVGRLSLI